MKNAEQNILENSDCVKEEALKRYAFGEPSLTERREIELHLAGCELCSDMVEGLRMYKSKEDFEKELNLLNRGIESGGRVISIKPIRKYLSIAAVLLIIAGSGIFISRTLQENSRREREVSDSRSFDKKNLSPEVPLNADNNPADTVKQTPEPYQNKNTEDVSKIKAVVEESKEISLVSKEQTYDDASDLPIGTSETGEAFVPSDLPATAMNDHLQKQEVKAPEVESRAAAPNKNLLTQETLIETVAAKRKASGRGKKKSATDQELSEQASGEDDEIGRAEVYRLFMSGSTEEAFKILSRRGEDGDTISYLKAMLEKKSKLKSENLFRSVRSGSAFYRASQFELGLLMKERGDKGWERVFRELSKGQDSTAVRSRQLLGD